MFTKQPPQDAHVQTFDAPVKEPNETVTQTHQHYLIVAAALLTDLSNTDADNRYNELVLQWVSVIPNLKTQERLREKRKLLLEERLKGIENNNQIGRITKAVSIEISGEISEIMDHHKGNNPMNRISAIVPDPILRAWMTKQNPEMFLEHPEDIQIEYDKQKAERLAAKKDKKDKDDKKDEVTS